ncbi:MAG: leucine-rich repeat protein [Ruminococcus sp.]|nr:leucine-rich repeat protein [Ruminococcus sp.]
MKLKKITAAVCAAALALGAAGLPVSDVFGGEFAVTASAADEIIANGTCGENVKWQLDSAGTLTISGTGEMEDYGEASETPWYSYKKDIKKAVIAKGVTSIGDCSFSGFSLESFSIAGSVKIIGEYAFYDSGSFTEINIPEGVETIKEGAFANNNGRNIKLSLPSTLRTLEDGGIGGISHTGVFFRTGITNAYLPEGLTYTGQYTFSECSRLKNVTLPKTLERIGEGCFRRCGKLESITIPSSVKRIDEGAFQNSGLLSVKIPDSVTETGRMAFSSCSNLKSITFSKNSKVLNSTCTSCNSLESVTIPEGVTKLNGTFNYCSNLSSITLPNTLTTIDRAFDDCSRLMSVTVPKSVTYIDGLGIRDQLWQTPYEDFVISCYRNSEAQTYAEKKGIKYVLLDGDTVNGDLNGDGAVDVDDVILAQKAAAGWKVSAEVRAAADVDGNGSVDPGDLIWIQKKAAGWKV